MPAANKFRHQNYPTILAARPVLRRVSVNTGRGADFSRLHTVHGIHNVLLVHGTFLGDDPIGISEILRSIGKNAGVLKRPFEATANKLADFTRSAATGLAKDVANYCDAFREAFQMLVGADPAVSLLAPTWSSQNHHTARADLAVRLFIKLHQLVQADDQRVLLWGHSHAGNGFAILSNLLANDRFYVNRFFAAAGDQGELWQQAQMLLARAPSPHPLARSIDIAAFGTPVRYGWDTNGYRSLVHVLHHRRPDRNQPFGTKPLFPPHRLKDIVTAQYGDWIQAFAIAGTDVPTGTALRSHNRVGAVLTAGLREPQHGAETRFIVPKHLKNACARWKTGTRCHADGLNLLLDYVPCGRKARTGQPIEESVLGHGVATTVDWLPTHLALVMQALDQMAW